MALKIVGGKSFVSLCNYFIHNDIVLFSSIYNTVPFFNYPVFTGTKIYIDVCDKDFPFFWLHPGIFPNAKQIYLNMSPYNRTVINIYNRQRTAKLYISGNYSVNFKRMTGPNVKFMNTTIIEALFDHVKNLPSELPVITPRNSPLL